MSEASYADRTEHLLVGLNQLSDENQEYLLGFVRGVYVVEHTVKQKATQRPERVGRSGLKHGNHHPVGMGHIKLS
jgi:hypothetical protein